MMSSSTVLELAQQLSAHLAPDLDPSQAAAYVVKEIKADTHGGSRKEWHEVVASIEGLARTARVRVQDDLADALEQSLLTLREHRMTGETACESEGPIKLSNLPDHLQLLLNLSNPPSSQTHDAAHAYLHRPVDNGPSPDELLYRQIMSEPFTGAHWGKGYDEEVKHGWTDSESSSGDSDVEVVTPSTGRIRSSLADRAGLRRLEDQALQRGDEQRLKAAEETLRAFKEHAYWRQGGGPIESLETDLYGWRALTTRASAIQLDTAIGAKTASEVKIVSAAVLQRELLLCLSGRPGVFFTFDQDSICQPTSGHPQVSQFSSTSLTHILDYFSSSASQAAQIRAFIVDATRPQASSSRSSPKVYKTTQAFAEACRTALSEYESWIADIETQMLRGVDPGESKTLPATPLALKLDLEERFGPLLDYLHPLLELAESPIPLLDDLYAVLQALPHTQATLRKSLFRTFLSSAEPMWQLLGDWLLRGMAIPSSLSAGSEEVHQSLDDEKLLDPESFIERDRDVSWTDEDFWENGYITSPEGLPDFLGHDAEELVMEAGKARGLLRAFEGGHEKQTWLTLEQVLKCEENVDVRVISARVQESISPICQLATFQLRGSLQEDCGLDLHLDAIEGLCFMAGHEVINEWIVELFSKIQQRKQWSDFQTLTSSLRDVIDARGAAWMKPSAIRIQARRLRSTAESPIIALGHVRATYDVPFPLSQLFTPTSMELRSEVFALLLQLRYAKHILLETRKHDTQLQSAVPFADVKVMWQVRQQLLWFISTLLSWLCRDVFTVQTARFREELEKATSLKSMIALELDHSRLIYGFALLHTKTQDLYENIMFILEMCVSLEQLCSASVKDSTPSGRHGFSEKGGRARRDTATSDEETQSEDDDAVDLSRHLAHEDLGTEMSKMRYRLNRTILAFSDGVEVLAGERIEGDGARSSEIWGILSFALADWQRFQI